MRLLQSVFLFSRRSYASNASVKLNTLQENIKYFKNIYGELFLKSFSRNPLQLPPFQASANARRLNCCTTTPPYT